jgi:hypothetical protein
MADAVLLAIMALALILFAIQEILVPTKRVVGSIVTRALTIGIIGLYLLYLYQEMGSAGGMGGGYGTGGGAGYVPM